MKEKRTTGVPALRIGMLGAAAITPLALIRPARVVPEVQLMAVAARDLERAAAFAKKHRIARVHETYDALLADPDIEAIYNPLPNGLHAAWTIRALEAGKHVLCEKPLAANAADAGRMAAAAEAAGLVLMEAFHYRYHPLAARVKQILDSGEIGDARHIEAHLCVPLPAPGNIRYRYDLAGGTTMDLGCYAINLIRFLAGAEPEVTSAEARLIKPQVDRWMEARFRFPNNSTARMTCSLLSMTLLRVKAVVKGDAGELRVLNPYFPQFYHHITVRSPHGTRRERVPGEATYTHQLRAFVQAVRGGAPVPTDARDAVANMRVIDAVYEKAGLKRREPV